MYRKKDTKKAEYTKNINEAEHYQTKRQADKHVYSDWDVPIKL